jgi:GDPmannose 4,6-dehydratase
MRLEYSGEGVGEVGTVVAIDPSVADPNMTTRVGDIIVRVDPGYYRPAEVQNLLGDASNAKTKLGWEPQISLDQMIVEMIAHDLEGARKQRLLKSHGFNIQVAKE